jgi:TetR/AcrR family transcriptional regulator, transcriptional repressor for nem operon
VLDFLVQLRGYSYTMSPHPNEASRPKLTSRGVATRNRIVLAAAELMHVRGVAATTIDEVLAASATSKSQFYQHFDDKTDLVYDVITLRADEILSWQRLRLEKVDSFRGLYQWRDAMVQRCTLRRGLWGCELGSLAAELSDSDDKARMSLAEHFTEWRAILAAALERMRDAGVLVEAIDALALATGLLAAVEGGYLLTQTTHDPRLMQTALDSAIGHVTSFRSVTAEIAD